MWVGGLFYSRESYTKEALKMGASKKIAYVPHGLEIGKTKIYLISDMTEVERKEYKSELKRRGKVARDRAAQDNSKPTRTGFGPLPRGKPYIFAYFVVNSVSYIVSPGMDMPEELKKRKVKSYTLVEGEFGTNDERECGSLKLGGTYLLSEEDMTKVKDLASSANVGSSNVHVLENPIPYSGKRFTGMQESNLEV